jgi:VWFA-related protein
MSARFTTVAALIFVWTAGVAAQTPPAAGQPAGQPAAQPAGQASGPASGQASGQPAGQAADQPRPPAFRVSVDVVAVDVQVIDKTGRPVPDLGPEKFTVQINGRKRRVVSAERIESYGNEGPARAGTPAGTSTAAAQLGRVIVLAVDCISFDTTTSHEVMKAARDFIERLSPDDFLGLSAYPNGPKINPTRDHAAVSRALANVVGQRDMAPPSPFQIRNSEIIDITRELIRGGGPTIESVVERECVDVDPVCRTRLIQDVQGMALYYEGQATASLGMLRSLVEQMSGIAGRKTLVLVSGGMIASDTPGGRPDLGELGVMVGKEAALANTAIYTLYVDVGVIERFSAQTRAGNRDPTNWSRDNAVMGRWLEQFSGAAGGALFTVQVGNGETSFNRILGELSSYYLLGVEPADLDRDGRTHEISVKTTEPNVTIRGRRWVTIPKRAGGTEPAATTTKGKSAAEPIAANPPSAPPTEPPPPPRRVVPPEIQSLADAYDRKAYDSVQRTISQSRDLANLIRAMRTSDSPWPNDPKRSAVFALELGLAGLRSDNGYARDEGGRLLSEYHARVRQPNGPDAFECWWFFTESTALEGLFMPENAMLFIPRAVQRCSNEPRLHLAYAFVSEQQWLRGSTLPTDEGEIVRRYEEAMKFPETAFEARVRAGRFLFGVGQYDRALEVLTTGKPQTKDVELLYLRDLVRGQVLQALNRPDEAAAAYRSALTSCPGAQSARVALMTLLVSRGSRDEAAALADAAQTANDEQFDPWWTYWLGDFRAYPAILDRLREMAK